MKSRWGQIGAALAAALGVWAAAAGPALAKPAPKPPAPAPVPGPTPSGFNFGVGPFSEPGAPKRAAFDLDGSAGQTINDRVEISNDGPAPKTFWVYPANAYSTQLGGGFALTTRGDKAVDVATWIALAVGEYTVPAHTASVIPFRITIPADATPGDHVAGVVAEEFVGSDAVKSGAGVTTIHRVAARVYLRVAGTLHPALHLQGFADVHHLAVLPGITGTGSARVSFLVANTGNSRVGLDHVTITITGLFGHEIHSRTLRGVPAGQVAAAGQSLPAQVLPGSTVELSTLFDGLPPTDHATVTVSVDGFDPVTTRPVTTVASRSFWLIPWLVVAVVAAVLLAVALWRRRPRVRPATEGGPTTRPPAPVAAAHR